MKVCESMNTLQGEGKYVGVPSYFVRTTGCNLRCAWKNPDGSITKCDTPYSSWNPEAGEDMGAEQILDKLKGKLLTHIVITGGEPTLQADLPEVVKELVQEGYTITIETNGTRYVELPKENVLLSISPKLKTSYSQPNESFERKLHERNNHFSENIKRYVDEGYEVQLKFVYNTPDDEEEIVSLLKELDCVFDNQVWCMPQGITEEQFKQKQKEMFNVCMKKGWNYSPRLHIDVFGNKRGI